MKKTSFDDIFGSRTNEKFKKKEEHSMQGKDFKSFCCHFDNFQKKTCSPVLISKSPALKFGYEQEEKF